MLEIESPIWCSGWQALGLSASTAQQQQLIDYLLLLQRWNKAYNLTAVRDMDAMLVLHLWDSLSVHPYIQGEHLLDVGSGAGLPGIPLAVINPQQQWTLLDTNGKKTRFIQQAIGELRLANVTVVQARIEQWQPKQQFEGIISRAFAALSDFVRSSTPHLHDSGVLYAMKGRYPADELSSLPHGWQVQAAHSLHVPTLDAERHLIELVQTNPIAKQRDIT